MAKRAALTVVRDPGKREKELPEKTVLPPSEPPEPEWDIRFPIAGLTGEERKNMQRVRGVAHDVWHRWVRVLKKAGVLNEVHAEVLAEAVTCVARIEQCEREISRYGIQVVTDRGVVMNRAITAGNQYRAQLKTYVVQLGLAPNVSLRPRPDPGDDDGVWDD